jgi:hypothetical protein
VHALYLVLLQQSWCGGPEQPDVPVILAPVPFVGASLQPLKLQVREGGIMDAQLQDSTAFLLHRIHVDPKRTVHQACQNML